MNTNLQGVLQGVIQQGNIDPNKSQSNKQSQIITQQMITTTNQSIAQYQLGSEQPSFGVNVNETGYIGSPRTVTMNGIYGQSSGNGQKINSTQSNMTTHYNSSLVSPAPTRTYQYSSSTFQSPEQNITAFNVGGYNPTYSSAGNTTKTITYKTGHIATDREIDSTSQVQQQLYKTSSPLGDNNSRMAQAYQYKRIISNNGSDKRVKNDGSISPVNNLMEGEINSAGEKKFFSIYQGGNQRAAQSHNITFKTIPDNQTIAHSSYQYQPIKASSHISTTQQQPATTFNPPVTISNGNNIAKQTFESHSYNYKPSLVNTVNFSNANAANVAGRYGSNNGISTSANYYMANGQNINNKQTTQTITTVNQSLPVYQTYQTYNQSQSIPLPQQQSIRQQQHSINISTQIQNNKSQQTYQVIDQIERPNYQKLYGLEENMYGARMAVEQDPPTKKGCCGPLCWLPLLLIGAVLALFGMLCGLGVVCPGGGSLKTVGTVESVLVEPSVVLNTSKPQVLKPTIVQPAITPQTVTPTPLQPQSLPQFNPGIPSPQTVTPSYIPPLSIPPSANPVAPILPSNVVVIPANNTSLPIYNATVPAKPQPVIEISPQVVKYDKKIDEYTIDATPHIVGVVTNVNSEVMNQSSTTTVNNNTQGISSFFDYRTNGTTTNVDQTINDTLLPSPPVTTYISTVNTTTIPVVNASISPATPVIDTTPTYILEVTETTITSPPLEITPPVILTTSNITNTTTATAVVDNDWIHPQIQTTTTTTKLNMTTITPEVPLNNSNLITDVDITPLAESTTTKNESVITNTTQQKQDSSQDQDQTGYVTTVEEVAVTNANTNNDVDANISTLTTTSNLISPDYIQLQPHIIPSTVESASTITTFPILINDTFLIARPQTEVDHIEPTIHIEPDLITLPTTDVTTPESNSQKVTTVETKMTNSTTNNNVSALEIAPFTSPTLMSQAEIKTSNSTVKSNNTYTSTLPLTASNALPEIITPTIENLTQPSIDIDPLLADIEPSTK